MNPYKDVVVNVGGTSVNKHSIYLHHQFLYQLDSSVLPPKRAYPKVTEWSIVDKYDAEHDKPTGQWAVYANRDLVDVSGKTIAKRGERIGGSDFDVVKQLGVKAELFKYEHRDGKEAQITITATQPYLDMVSSDSKEQAWRAYVQMTRIKAGDKIVNTFTETINGVSRPSNEVETSTAQLQAAISIKKFDQTSGPDRGDRNTPAEALENAKDGIQIVFRVTNTGQVPLTSLQLRDQTIKGSGRVEHLRYPKDFDRLILRPGDSIDITGELTGVEEGDSHTDRADLSGVPLVDCPVVDENPWDDSPGVKQVSACKGQEIVAQPDDWNGKRPRPRASDLPQTGANVLVLALLALSLLGASIPFFTNALGRLKREHESRACLR